MPQALPTRIILAVAALALAGALAACGGGEEDPQEVIQGAFSEPIESADVNLSADLEVEGSEQLSDPIRIQVSGPFRSGGSERIPSFDFDVALQGGGSEVPPVGLVSTGKNVFVEVQGVAYEVGEDVVAEQNRQLAQGSDEGPGLGALGVDPRDWIEGAEVEGDAEVAGVETTHVSASVDVPGLLADLNEAAQQATGTGAGPAPTLTEEQRTQLEEAIREASFDVFAGKDDGKLRRLAAGLGFQVPEGSREDLGGIESGTLSFSLELASVDGDQQIEAPEDVRPLEDLARQLGGLGGLLGGPGGSGGEGQDPEGGAESPGGEAGSASPAGEAFERYGRCLRQADPTDQQALEACNELIQP